MGKGGQLKIVAVTTLYKYVDVKSVGGGGGGVVGAWGPLTGGVFDVGLSEERGCWRWWGGGGWGSGVFGGSRGPD